MRPSLFVGQSSEYNGSPDRSPRSMKSATRTRAVAVATVHQHRGTALDSRTVGSGGRDDQEQQQCAAETATHQIQVADEAGSGVRHGEASFGGGQTTSDPHLFDLVSGLNWNGWGCGLRLAMLAGHPAARGAA